MPVTKTGSNTTAPTQFLQVNGHSYAYRRFGNGSGLPLLCLQHFTGTLDNWDPAVTDPLASGRDVILFDNAGVGRSAGDVPETIAGMTEHSLAILDGLGIKICDVLGFSLGGVIAQQMAQDRPSILRRMILVGTAPRGGEDIMLLEMHDVLTAARSRAHEDQTTKDRRSVLGHLLGDHPTERETENVAGLYSKSVKKGHGVFCHSGDRLRDVAGGTPNAGVVEEDYVPTGGKRISHRWIPVVERP